MANGCVNCVSVYAGIINRVSVRADSAGNPNGVMTTAVSALSYCVIFYLAQRRSVEIFCRAD